MYFVIESNAIEGIRTPLIDVHDAMKSSSVTGHVGAFLLADSRARGGALFTKELLSHAHTLIIDEQNARRRDEDYIPLSERGAYRKCNVAVGGSPRAPHQHVSKRMRRLFHDIHHLQKQRGESLQNPDIDGLVSKMADIHFDYLDIHPFVDGNGRTSRILAWFLFRSFGMTPFIFTAEDRFETYYPACTKRELMRSYFMSRYVT